MTNRRQERGYNLIEVLIAMAILGLVLLGILTLFIMGRRNVYSGKQMTQAVAAATRIVEDLHALEAGEIYTILGVATTPTPTALGPNIVAGESYADSIVRHTDAIGADPSGYQYRWKQLVSPAADPNRRFAHGRITIVLQPREPRLDAAGVPMALTTATATVLRVRAVVEWGERANRRHVSVDTVKLARQ